MSNYYQGFFTNMADDIEKKIYDWNLCDDIPQNDYSYPTEIREEVVKAIISKMLNSGFIDIDREYKALYYSNGNISRSIRTNEENIRVHGIEVQCAFSALQKKGYYIQKVDTTYFVAYYLKESNTIGDKSIDYAVFDYNIDNK